MGLSKGGKVLAQAVRHGREGKERHAGGRRGAIVARKRAVIETRVRKEIRARLKEPGRRAILAETRDTDGGRADCGLRSGAIGVIRSFKRASLVVCCARERERSFFSQ